MISFTNFFFKKSQITDIILYPFKHWEPFNCLNSQVVVRKSFWKKRAFVTRYLIVSSDLPGAKEGQPSRAGAEWVLPLYPGKTVIADALTFITDMGNVVIGIDICRTDSHWLSLCILSSEVCCGRWGAHRSVAVLCGGRKDEWGH